MNSSASVSASSTSMIPPCPFPTPDTSAVFGNSGVTRTTSFQSNVSALPDLAYFAKHSVHVLVSNLATALLQDRPSNVMLYIHQWTRTQLGGTSPELLGMTGSACVGAKEFERILSGGAGSADPSALTQQSSFVDPKYPTKNAAMNRRSSVNFQRRTSRTGIPPERLKYPPGRPLAPAPAPALAAPPPPPAAVVALTDAASESTNVNTLPSQPKTADKPESLPKSSAANSEANDDDVVEELDGEDDEQDDEGEGEKDEDEDEDEEGDGSIPLNQMRPREENDDTLSSVDNLSSIEPDETQLADMVQPPVMDSLISMDDTGEFAPQQLSSSSSNNNTSQLQQQSLSWRPSPDELSKIFDDPTGKFGPLECISRGHYGTVYRAQWLEKSEEVAIKKVAIDGPWVLNEYYNLLHCSCSRVVACHACYYDRLDDNLWIVMECMAYTLESLLPGSKLLVEQLERMSAPQDGGGGGGGGGVDTDCSASHQPQPHQPTTPNLTHQQKMEKFLCGIIKQCLYGLIELQVRSRVHLDIKPANLFFDDLNLIKIGDLGTMSVIGEPCIQLGDFCFMAPEVAYSEGLFTDRSDVWSIGALILTLLDGAPPLCREDPNILMYIHHSTCMVPSLLEPFKWSPELNDFIKVCFIKNAMYRPSAQDLLQHAWIRKWESEST